MNLIKETELKAIQLTILKSIDQFCQENGIKYSLAFGTLLGAVRHGGYIPWDDDIDIMMPREDYEKFIKFYNSNRYKVMSFPKDKRYIIPYAKVIDSYTILKENTTLNLEIGVNIDVFPIDKCPSYKEEFLWYKRKWILNNIYAVRKLVLDRKRSVLKNCIIILTRILTFPISLKNLCCLIQKMALKYKNTDNGRMAVLATADTKQKWMIPANIFKKYKRIIFENSEFWAIEDTDTYLKATYGDYMSLPPEQERITHHDFIAYWKN